jgi:hypothetical protein
VLETLFGKLLGWVPSPLSPVRLRYTITAKLCTYAHPFVIWAGTQLPPAAVHIDVTLELWVPEHRTTVRAITAQAAGNFRRPTCTSSR